MKIKLWQISWLNPIWEVLFACNICTQRNEGMLFWYSWHAEQPINSLPTGVQLLVVDKRWLTEVKYLFTGHWLVASLDIRGIGKHTFNPSGTLSARMRVQIKNSFLSFLNYALKLVICCTSKIPEFKKWCQLLRFPMNMLLNTTQSSNLSINPFIIEGHQVKGLIVLSLFLAMLWKKLVSFFELFVLSPLQAFHPVFHSKWDSLFIVGPWVLAFDGEVHPGINIFLWSRPVSTYYITKTSIETNQVSSSVDSFPSQPYNAYRELTQCNHLVHLCSR